jgi:hypothetical protein
MRPGASVFVYTVIVGGYDLLLPPRVSEPGVRRVVFSERRPWPAWGWEWRPLPDFAATLPPVLANRWCKFFAHEILPEARLSIYVDGNVRLKGLLRPLIDEFEESGAALGLFLHPDRANFEDEAEACLYFSKIKTKEDQARLQNQLDRYRDGGLSPQFGLTENSIIFRNHADPALPAAMRIWWQEICTGVARDQISLPWVRYITGITTKIWPWSFRRPNPYFYARYRHHRPSAGLRRNLGYLFDVVKNDSSLTAALHATLKPRCRSRWAPFARYQRR